MAPPTRSVVRKSHIPHVFSSISHIPHLIFTNIPPPRDHFITASHIPIECQPPTSQMDLMSPPASLSYFLPTSRLPDALSPPLCKSPSIKETRRAEKTYATSSLTHGQRYSPTEANTRGPPRTSPENILFSYDSSFQKPQFPMNNLYKRYPCLLS